MSVLREQFANDATTTLASSANTSTTSLALTDGSAFPSVGNFRIKADSEIMLATARSSNTLTVVRAQEGTSAASHSGGATVSQILTAGALLRLGTDNNPLFNYALPFRLVDDSGAAIVASDFTQVNISTHATVTDQNGTIALRDLARNTNGDSGENLRLLYRTAPSPSYSYAAAFQCLQLRDPTGGLANWGFGFRDGSGKVEVIAFQISNGGAPNLVRVFRFDDATTFDSTVTTFDHGNIFTGPVWFKIEDDNTNLNYYIGDGAEWVKLYSTSRTAFFSSGPTQVCWYANNNAVPTHDMLVRLCHFSRLS